jgi:ankyrin repeat protein
LDQLPETLDETYEHTLRRIDKVKQKFAHRLFQCLAISVRPLRVEELAEILAVRFDAGEIPQFNTGWRLGDAEEAVLSACSSLITVINVNGSRIVQFSHFSVKEFLTSDRVATTSEDFCRYHTIPHLAHATLAQACLGVLLQLDDRIDKDSIKNFPLADYAARHWFEHGRVENVPPTIRDATLRLFDREKSHFSAWIWIYDINDPWRNPMPIKHPERPEASPLYYSIHCRIRWLIEHLMETYPRDIRATGGYFKSSWIVAFEIGNIDVATALLRCGADATILNSRGHNPLHDAATNGRADIVRLILEHNVDVDLPAVNHRTPLSVASSAGSSEVAWILIQKGANVDSRSLDGWTPLNEASVNGHLDVVRLLIDNGADLDIPNDERQTPSHSAANNGHLDVVKLLLKSGADFNTRNTDGKTALDLAFDNGKSEVANFLSGHTAGATPLDSDGLVKQSGPNLKPRAKPSHTAQPLRKYGERVRPNNDEQLPLYTASQYGQLDVVRSLLEQGSDVNETSSIGSRRSALHAASVAGKLEVANFLIERGAYVNMRSRGGWIPLHHASVTGNLVVTQLLHDHGADIEAKMRHGWSALHLASAEGHLQIAQLLAERGADVVVRNPSGRTPGQEATIRGHHEIAEFLSNCGT